MTTRPSENPPSDPAPWPWAPPSRQVLSGRRHRYVSPISTVTSGSPRAGVGGETRPGDGAVPSTAAFSPGPGSPSPATPEVAAATAAAAPCAAIAVVEMTPESGATQPFSSGSATRGGGRCRLEGGACDVASAHWLVWSSRGPRTNSTFLCVALGFFFPSGSMAEPRVERGERLS